MGCTHCKRDNPKNNVSVTNPEPLVHNKESKPDMHNKESKLLVHNEEAKPDVQNERNTVACLFSACFLSNAENIIFTGFPASKFDCILVDRNNHEYHIHTTFLFRASTVFAAIEAPDQNKDGMLVLKIQDYDHVTLLPVMNFMYAQISPEDVLPANLEELFNLLQFTHQYDLEVCYKECEKKFLKSVKPDVSLELLVQSANFFVRIKRFEASGHVGKMVLAPFPFGNRGTTDTVNELRNRLVRLDHGVLNYYLLDLMKNGWVIPGCKITYFNSVP